MLHLNTTMCQHEKRPIISLISVCSFIFDLFYFFGSTESNRNLFFIQNNAPFYIFHLSHSVKVKVNFIVNSAICTRQTAESKQHCPQPLSQRSPNLLKQRAASWVLSQSATSLILSPEINLLNIPLVMHHQ